MDAHDGYVLVDVALWFARRKDAEAVSEDDENTWYIVKASKIKAEQAK